MLCGNHLNSFFISILQTNPQRRATIKSLLNHDWVMKGYAAPVRWMSRIKVLNLFPEDFLYSLCVSAVLNGACKLLCSWSGSSLQWRTCCELHGSKLEFLITFFLQKDKPDPDVLLEMASYYDVHPDTMMKRLLEVCMDWFCFNWNWRSHFLEVYIFFFMLWI